MQTVTLTYMPADEHWFYDPLENPLHNCPAHHQFGVTLLNL